MYEHPIDHLFDHKLRAPDKCILRVGTDTLENFPKNIESVLTHSEVKIKLKLKADAPPEWVCCWEISLS